MFGALELWVWSLALELLSSLFFSVFIYDKNDKTCRVGLRSKCNKCWLSLRIKAAQTAVMIFEVAVTPKERIGVKF